MENKLTMLGLILSILYQSTDATVRVETKLGTIVGNEKTVTTRHGDFEIQTFLGVPYAKPPVGELRWEKPVLVEPFTEPYIADKYSPVCSQVKVQAMQGYDRQSEDCLYMNIYVPVQEADEVSGHAVMIFLHGGGLEMGAGETYEGDKLAALGNVIVITFNYRLGIFGFLSSGEKTIPGNMGLFDQNMAFQWVNKYISGFGGDPSRVTVFGQSAGGTSVFYQGLYEGNKDLIHRLIPQSGVPIMAAVLNSDPKPQFDFIAKGFGCEADTVEQSVTCMKEKDTKTVIKTMETLIERSAENPAEFMFVHFVLAADGEMVKKDFLPNTVGRQARFETLPQVEYFRTLDLMTGYNIGDASFLLTVPEFVPIEDPDNFLPTREEFSGNLMAMPLGFYFGAEVPSAVSSLIVSQYTDWSDPNNPERIRNKYKELWNEIYFGKGTNEFTIIHANSTKESATYLYRFSAPTSMHLVKIPKWATGATHGDELPFIFNFVEKLLKDTNENLTVDSVQDWEWELSRKLIQLWSNFAKSGNPNKPVTIENTPVWPEYDLADQIAMDLDKDMSETSVMRFYNAENNNFWMETIPNVMEAIEQDHPGHPGQQGQCQSSGSPSTQQEKILVISIFFFCLKVFSSLFN